MHLQKILVMLKKNLFKGNFGKTVIYLVIPTISKVALGISTKLNTNIFM